MFRKVTQFILGKISIKCPNLKIIASLSPKFSIHTLFHAEKHLVAQLTPQLIKDLFLKQQLHFDVGEGIIYSPVFQKL